MKHIEQWIWLPKDKYTNAQNTVYSGFEDKTKGNYTVAEFKKEYVFSEKVVSAELRFSGDTAFQLYCNDSVVATGPACVGGDFIGNETGRENFYAFETTIKPDSEVLNFFARVKMMPVQICEYSKGRGGFMLSAILTFADGTQKHIFTDDSWMVRQNRAYKSFDCYDGRISPDEYTKAECIENIWNTSTAPIPVREESDVFCENSKISVSPYEEKNVLITFDKIWAGFIHVKAKTQGELSVCLTCRELEESPSIKENLIFVDDGEYRSFYMNSAGNISVEIKNESAFNAELTVSFVSTHYPVSNEATTVTSDEELNLVLETCKHTLKICRQTHHLDSPKHCEPLACTGDYYVETLMTLFSFGDMRLAEFDLIRTAVMLERENGRMFHTTYSLIWVKMLYDVYMATGNIDLLKKCEKALQLLLKRFKTYIGANGLIETPPDYMFVDWIYIDEISMHHPPKALGQTCLNIFYFGALDTAEKIFRELSQNELSVDCANERENLRKAINSNLFDAQKGIYFMGLNTPTEESLIGGWMPQNTDKRYYMKHANILAAYFGVCDEATSRTLVKKILSDEIEGDCQPYFLHYLLEAVCKLGLREEYTMQICKLWKKPVQECSKGLVEGFIAPEPTYSFDHSHAWGGTPLYSLPKALIGLEIISPGMGEIALSPSLLGLEYAKVELLTPHGKVICQMEKNKEPIITNPKEVMVKLR